MKKILGLVTLGSVMSSPAWAVPLKIVYPPDHHQTTAQRIFFVGTAPSQGEVLVNGKVVARSQSGNFAPSLPLNLGDNVFTWRYQNQQQQITVKRLATTPEPPVGLAFSKDSLTPSVDIARLPGELVCFSAIAPPQATVTARLGKQTIPLLPQPQVQLPANSAALTGQNQPYLQAVVVYNGCTAIAAEGKPLFQLTLGGKTITQPGPGAIQMLLPAQLAVVEVIVDAGVARTGPSTDYARLTPLPKGTQASVTAREGEWLRLDYGGWINSQETRRLEGAVPPRSLIRSIRARAVSGATEVIFPLQVPVPVSVQQGDRTFTLTLYNTTAQTDVIRVDQDRVISRLDWQQLAPGQVQYTFNLHGQQWGYRLKYEGTSLVLSLRHPPASIIHSGKAERQSLSGVKILLDPGHGGAELGARGPTGYAEKDINLLISKLVRTQLVARGATVYMTRTTDQAVSLADRVAMIDKLEPAIALSLHYNSLPDDGDAINTQGFAAFWYHPQAHDLAIFLNNYIVQQLQRPNYGVYWNNLALTRPATAPAVLLELGFMINPTEFEWIVDPQAQQELATAIANGITKWFSKNR